MHASKFGGRRYFVAFVLCAALLIVAGPARADLIDPYVWNFDNPPPQGPTIQDLLDGYGGHMQVGDKIFTFYNDSVTTTATVGTVAPGADAIRLAGVQVPALVGDYGLRFNGGWSAGGQEIADTTLLFSVEIAEPQKSRLYRIHDNALWLTAFGVSGTGEGGIVSVSENVYAQNPREAPPDENPPVANKFVYYRTDSDMELIEHKEFVGVPLDTIWVLKDVVANGGDLDTGAAHLSEFYQTFSQTVIPEPATVGLLALGGVSLVVAGLRRRKSVR